MRKYIWIGLLVSSVTAWGQPAILVTQEDVENAYPRLSKDGRRILYQSNETGKWQLYICDITGAGKKRITNDRFNDNLPDWSADNKWIAFVSDWDGNEDIYIMNADGGQLTRVTNDPGRDIHPYFSPDGKYLLFNSTRDGVQFDVFRYDIAKKTTEQLTHTPDDETCARYAPDMKSIVLLKNSATADDIYILHTGSQPADNLTKTPYVNHGWPMYSADGKWIYYSSMEKGTYSIYRIHPDGTGKKQITHAKSGEEHARVNVARNGKFMIYNIKKGKTISIVKEDLPE